MSRICLLIFSCLILSACTSNEIGNSDDVDPDTIYLDYFISGDEDKDHVKVLLQFRYGGAHGTTLILRHPSQVELDGQLVKGDSSKMTGAFYEVLKPVAGFTGKHKITFTDINKKKYEEEFSFQPFKPKEEIPAVLKRGELVFEMEGLNPVDYVRVFATDTSFPTPGINRVDTVKNGRIIISLSDLDNLSNGPINLELYKEDERPVKNGTREGGRISINYGIKREFELRD